VNEIICAFGVPLSCLGDSSDARYQTSPEDRRNMWLNACLPRAHEFQDHLNLRLAPLLGTDMCWFDTSTVQELRTGLVNKPVDLVEAVANHLMTRDEARSYSNLPDWVDVDPDDTPFGMQAGEGVLITTPANPVPTFKSVPVSGDVPAAKVTPPAPPVESPARSDGIDMVAAARVRREVRRAQPKPATKMSAAAAAALALAVLSMRRCWIRRVMRPLLVWRGMVSVSRFWRLWRLVRCLLVRCLLVVVQCCRGMWRSLFITSGSLILVRLKRGRVMSVTRWKVP
jgi:hypothetical protein